MYDPYGSVAIYSASWALISDSSYSWDIGFQGLMQDDATGLIYGRHRYEHPALGRWMNRDPIGEPGQMMMDFTQVPTPAGMAFASRDGSDINAAAVNGAQANIAIWLGRAAGNAPWAWKYADGMNLYLYERSNPATRLDPSGMDIFINCTDIHESICIGWPPASATCFSFGLNASSRIAQLFEIMNPWNNDGVVYIENPITTPVQACCHLLTNAKQDSDALAALNAVVNTPGNYRLVGSNCRSFSNDMCDFFKKQTGLKPV